MATISEILHRIVNSGLWERAGESTAKLALAIVLIALGYLAGRGMRAVYNRSRRAAPTSGSILAGKALVITMTLLLAGVALTQVYHVNLLSLFATLGIVSLALGFGLQNTVANLAAGVALSFDKPFQVGDRIRVGETWGDVTSIGLRSTRIKTTSGEVVAVPNAVLDTQEVWNNTQVGQGQLRVEMPIDISYGSSIALAEDICLRAARRHPHVQAFPEPQVQVKGFGDNGIHLELRVWLDEARLKPRVSDDLFRTVKAGFDEQGVHFPFPQRTVSYLKDMDAAAPTPAGLHEEVRRPVVLVCTRSSVGAQAMATKVVDFLERLGATMVILHVRPRAQAFDRTDADRALNHYLAVAVNAKMPARARAEVGEFVPCMVRVAKEEGTRLVLFGQSQSSRLGGWLRHEIQDAVKASPAPVLPLQTDLTLDDTFVERWRHRIQADET